MRAAARVIDKQILVMLSVKTLPEPKIGTREDIDRFRAQCVSMGPEWKLEVDKSHKGGCKVWRKTVDFSPVDTVRVWYRFEGVSASDLYDVLHDDVYRVLWDEAMIEGYEIERLGPCDDVGYYSAKAPNPVKNRDFCNQRTWYVSPDKQEYIIFNHSVKHPACPVKDDFVRAISFDTGYLIRKFDKDCEMTYIGQSNPGGWIPSWLINAVVTKYAPQMMETLHDAARGYAAWKAQHEPDYKPWYGSNGATSENDDDESESDNDETRAPSAPETPAKDSERKKKRRKRASIEFKNKGELERARISLRPKADGFVDESPKTLAALSELKELLTKHHSRQQYEAIGRAEILQTQLKQATNNLYLSLLVSTVLALIVAILFARLI